MTQLHGHENCPRCGDVSALRPKLLLIDAAWVNFPIGHPEHKDPRLIFIADLRADDVKLEHLNERPLEQFVDGFYCDRCGHGFVEETVLREGRRRYY